MSLDSDISISLHLAVSLDGQHSDPSAFLPSSSVTPTSEITHSFKETDERRGVGGEREGAYMSEDFL